MDGEIVFIADAWGAKHGGINSFNQDLCSALAKLLEDKYRIGCIVLDYSDDEYISAKKTKVELIKLNPSEQKDKIEGNRIDEILEKVRNHNFGNVLWWIGHDVFTGQLAIEAKNLSHSGQSAVIHHMNYEAYVYIKERYGGDEGYNENKNSEETRIKIKEQRDVLLQADVVFAVGPKLSKSAMDKIRGSYKEVVELIPGLAEIEGLDTPEIFSAITYGRLDSRNDRNKQGSLVVEAFGRAKSISYNPLGYDAKLLVIGLSLDKQQEESDKIRKLVEIQAKRAVNIIPLPYMEDRDELFELLRQQSVCLMVSLHEGFGLVGWEAIAAEVPLIVSRNSGLYDAINNLLGGPGLGCLKTIDIKGSHADKPYREEDIEEITKLLIEIKTSGEESKENAKKLKELLKYECTWQNTALKLAKACNLEFTWSLASKNEKQTGLESVSEISNHFTKFEPQKNEIEKAEEKSNQELIDFDRDTKRVDSKSHLATDIIEDTDKCIDSRLKTILDNIEVLFIGEEVSEKSGIKNIKFFIVEIIESITEHDFSGTDCDELKKNLRPESAFRILYDELGNEILIFFEQFINCEPNDLHYYIANEIKKGKWIFTTNIDNLIEEACKNSKIDMKNKIIYTDDKFEEFYKNTRNSQTLPIGCLFKLNGTIEEEKVGDDRFESFKFSLNQMEKDLKLNKIKVLKYFLKNFDLCFMGYNCLDDFSIYPSLYTPTEKAIFWFNYEKKPIEIISAKMFLEAEIEDEKNKRNRDIKTLYINHILSKRKRFLKISGNWMDFIQKKLCPLIDINRYANLSQIKDKKTSVELPKLCEIINNYQKNIIIGRLWEECLSREKAIMFFEEAENLGEGIYKAKAKLSLARVYDVQYGRSREEKVIMKYHEAFEIYKYHGIITEAAQCKIRLANFKRRALKQFNEACKDCEEAKQMFDLVEKKDKTYKIAYAEYSNCLGLIYSKLGGDFISQCDNLFKNSLKYRKESGDFEGEAETENAIGLTKRNKLNNNIEEINDAIWHLVRAKIINESIGNYIGIARNLRNLGLCYTDLISLVENKEAKKKNFRTAKESYENSVSYWYIMKGDPPVEDLLECHYRLGELEVNHGDINEGINFLKKVENQYEKKENHWHNRARTLDLLCKAYNSDEYIDTKGIEDAKRTIKKIIDIYKKILNDQNMQKSMRGDEDKFRNANEILERIKKTIRKLGLKDDDEYYIIENDNILNNIDEILEKFRTIMSESANNISRDCRKSIKLETV